MAERPYTPETLAERWGCSPQHIRAMIRRGELAAFRLGGKLLRITAMEVERWETQSPSVGTEESSAPSSAPGAADSAARSARLIPASRGLALLNFSGSGSKPSGPRSRR